jgi:hypothetical protein
MKEKEIPLTQARLRFPIRWAREHSCTEFNQENSDTIAAYGDWIVAQKGCKATMVHGSAVVQVFVDPSVLPEAPKDKGSVKPKKARGPKATSK